MAMTPPFCSAVSTHGGAIYQALIGDVTVVESTLTFSNNSAYQGGTFYFTSPVNLVIGTDSFVLFIDNFVSNAGGAVFAYVPSILPCFLALTNYSGALKFQGNSAGIKWNRYAYIWSKYTQ